MELQERPSLGRLQRTAPRMMVLVSFVPLADMAKEAIGSLDLRLRANLNRDRTDNERNKAASQGNDQEPRRLHSFPTNVKISSPLNLPLSASALAMVSTCDQCSSMRAFVRSVTVDKRAEAVSMSPLAIHRARSAALTLSSSSRQMSVSPRAFGLSNEGCNQ